MKKNPSQAILDAVRQQGGEPESPRDVLRALLTYLDEEAERAKPKPVVCPECAAAGIKSRIVRGGPSMVGGQGYYKPKEFFDEDGRKHDHDENNQRYTLYYACSEGHEFDEAHMRACWCGWAGEPLTPPAAKP